jgi:putative ABC transport system permease protein
VPASAIDAARGIRGASAVVETTTTTLGPGLGTAQQPIQAAVVGAGAIERVLDLDMQHGSLRRFADGAVALSEGRAEQADATVGDRVAVMLGDGSRRTLEVAAIYGRGLGFGEVLLPAATVAGHLTSPLMTSVLVRSEDGAADAVGRRLDALAARYPGMTVGDRHDIAVSVDENREANDWLFRILTGIVFVFAAIAVVNTLMMIGAHRTRELGLLRLVGGTSRQVRAMARWEAGMVVGLGVGLGGLVALITLVPTSEIVSGSSVPYAPIGLMALVLGSAAAVGFAGSALATRLALRVRPVDAIGMRE